MNETVTVKVKKLSPDASLPFIASEGAAGADLCACIQDSIIINPGETAMVKIGIAVEIPKGYVGLVFARSGLSTKKGLAPANKVGVIDSDYRGEIIVALHNQSQHSQTIHPAERIAQFIVIPYPAVEFIEVDCLSETQRGSGGFGSTGPK